MRLNIGAGEVKLSGFVPVDRRVGKEAYPLEYDDDSVDEIRASHVLEHFASGMVGDVLANWVSKLKPGGVIRIAVPDFEVIAGMVANSPPSQRGLAYAYAFGGQTDANDFHHAAFDPASLKTLMRHCGLRKIKGWQSTLQDCAALPVSLNLEGVKPHKHKLPAIVAAMSTSRLGFTENMFSATGVFPHRNVELVKQTGAYWSQCLDRVLTQFLDAGHDGYIVVLDYDTVFNGDIFDELCYLMADNPQADAIAPWQVKRESDHALVWMTDDDGKKRDEITYEELDRELMPVDSAHFGLTLLRSRCFKSLRRPWFLEIPDPNGAWGDGRIDPDIYFWNNWRECGNSLFMANHVSIGHCQQLVTWPDWNLKPIHQYLPDYQKSGPPRGARL